MVRGFQSCFLWLCCGLIYSTVSCPPRSLTWRSPAHRGDWLGGVLPTAESDSAVSCPPQSLTRRCPAHRGVWLGGVLPTFFIPFIGSGTFDSYNFVKITVIRLSYEIHGSSRSMILCSTQFCSTQFRILDDIRLHQFRPQIVMSPKKIYF